MESTVNGIHALALAWVLVNKYSEIDLKRVYGEISAQDVLDEFAGYIMTVGTAIDHIMKGNIAIGIQITLAEDDIEDMVVRGANAYNALFK